MKVVAVYKTLERPWGKMWLLADHPGWWIKVIRVNPGHRTSQQFHACRSELHVGLDHWHWKVIRPFVDHRMTPGLYLEFAWGDVFETDIVRTHDDYGRSMNVAVNRPKSGNPPVSAPPTGW